MGRGNRGKKKNKNIAVMDLLEDTKQTQSTEVLGGFSYSQCVTNPKKENKRKKKKLEFELTSNLDSPQLNEFDNDKNFNEKIDTFQEDDSCGKIDFFNKNDNELDLYEKRLMVDMFVNRYWNRICVCEPIEDIIIEKEHDNDSDEYFNDDY